MVNITVNSQVHQPVLTTLRCVCRLIENMQYIQATITRPVSLMCGRATYWGASWLARQLPDAAAKVNQWTGRGVITPQTLALLQACLREPNATLAMELLPSVERWLSTLASWLLEKPTMKLLGGKSEQRDCRLSQLFDVETINNLLTIQLLTQLFPHPQPEQTNLETEIQRLLSLLITLHGGAVGEVLPWQIDRIAFLQLKSALREANAYKISLQDENPQCDAVLQQYLSLCYASVFPQHFISSEMLMQWSGAPAWMQQQLFIALRNWFWSQNAASATSAAELPAGIHFPAAATLRSLNSAPTEILITTDQTAVLYVPQCPRGEMKNHTAQLPGFTLVGYGSEMNDGMEVYLCNNSNVSMPVYLRSKARATSFPSVMRPGPYRALTFVSSPTPDSKPDVANSALSLTAPLLSEPLMLPAEPMSWATWADSLVTRAVNRFGVEGKSRSHAGAPGYRWGRDVSVSRTRDQPLLRPNQYDRLQPQLPVPTPAAPSVTEAFAASGAVSHWLSAITYKPLPVIYAGVERYRALIDKQLALREIGRDPLVPAHQNYTLAQQVTHTLQVLSNLLTRTTAEAPFHINDREYALLQNDIRGGFYGGLPIISGGEESTHQLLVAEILLPLLDDALFRRSARFEGFGAITTKLISRLPEDDIPDISIRDFARAADQVTDAFCQKLQQQNSEFSAEDIARIRVLIDARMQKEFPVLRFSRNPQLLDTGCFDEKGMRLGIAATAIGDAHCSSISSEMALRIALNIMLTQSFAGQCTMLGQTFYVGKATGKERFKMLLQVEYKRMVTVLEFLRSRRALDKLEMAEQPVDAEAMRAAQNDFDEASRQFYDNALLALPQPIQQQFSRHLPASISVTLLHIAEPGARSPDKAFIGFIMQEGNVAWMISPLPALSDPSRPDVIDVSAFTSASGFYSTTQKRALSEKLFENDRFAPRHELTLTRQQLMLTQNQGGTWNQVIGEKIIALTGAQARMTTTLPSTTPLPPAQASNLPMRLFQNLMRFTGWENCVELLDEFFDPDREPQPALITWGDITLCFERLAPGGEEFTLLENIFETLTIQAFEQVKRQADRRRRAPGSVSQQEMLHVEPVEWQGVPVSGLEKFFARSAGVYAQPIFAPFLRKLVQHSTRPLSRWRLSPTPNSQQILNNLAGYAIEMTQREAGKHYLSHRFGDTWIDYQVISQSVTSEGEIDYRIPAGAPADRVVTVRKDKQGALQVIANSYIKLTELADDDESGNLPVTMPSGMALREVYVSRYNDDRLVIRVADQQGETYLRQLSAAGDFIEFEPGLFSTITTRYVRSIENDPSSASSADFHGLDLISDKERRRMLLTLNNFRKILLTFPTEMSLQIEIVYQANRLKNEPCYRVMQNLFSALPSNDVNFENYKAFLLLVENISVNNLRRIFPLGETTSDDYVEFIRFTYKAQKGRTNMLDVLELPGSDHSVTRVNIDDFKSISALVINQAGVYRSRVRQFRAAHNDYRHYFVLYATKYRSTMLKSSDSIINRLKYSAIIQRTWQEQANEVLNIASGEEIADKFPRLARDIVKTRARELEKIHLISQAINQDNQYLNRALNDIFHTRRGFQFNTTLLETLINEYYEEMEQQTEDNFDVFRDYCTKNACSNEKEYIHLVNDMEKQHFQFSGVEGSSTPGFNVIEKRVAIAETLDGHPKRVKATVTHEVLHYAIAQVIPSQLYLTTEFYLSDNDSPVSLSPEQMTTLFIKIMYNAEIFRTYIKRDSDFLLAFVQTCLYSSHAEMAGIAGDLEDNWQFPLTTEQRASRDRLIDLFFSEPQLKLLWAMYFPDSCIAMLNFLAKKAEEMNLTATVAEGLS